MLTRTSQSAKPKAATTPVVAPTPQSAPKAKSGIVKQVGRSVRNTVTGTLRLSGERMSKVDTAWLRMDSPANLMMIVGVWVLKPHIRHEDLCQRVQDKLLKYKRFTQAVVEDAAGATWVADTDFDLARHVTTETLPKGQPERQALQNRVAELAATPLSRRHPLWQLHLVEQYDGGSALLVRVHHCIADGIALIALMMGLVDGAELPAKMKRKLAEQDRADDMAHTWVVDGLIKPITQMTIKALDMTGQNMVRSVNLMADPLKSISQNWNQTVGYARIGSQLVSDLAALALMQDDAATSLKGKPSGHKAVAWCEPLPIDQVKAVAKAFDCSVNDVLLSCVAGAISRHLQQQGECTQGQEMRAMVPVNLRPLEDAWKLGNHFGLVPLVLPLGIDNPVQRVYEIKARMQALKTSTQPLLAFGLLSVAGLLVKPAQQAMLDLFAKKTTAVMTNVPGPAQKLTFCGATLEQTLFWVPQSGDIGVGVSILSYGGGVQFGLVTDIAMCDQPQAIVDEFAPQFDALCWLALMLPTAQELAHTWP